MMFTLILLNFLLWKLSCSFVFSIHLWYHISWGVFPCEMKKVSNEMSHGPSLCTTTFKKIYICFVRNCVESNSLPFSRSSIVNEVDHWELMLILNIISKLLLNVTKFLEQTWYPLYNYFVFSPYISHCWLYQQILDFFTDMIHIFSVRTSYFVG